MIDRIVETLNLILDRQTLILHRLKRTTRQQGHIMTTFQQVADELFATKTQLGNVNATLGGVRTAVNALRKAINDMRKASGISEADAGTLLALAKDLTSTALATDAEAAGIDTNPDDDEDVPPAS